LKPRCADSAASHAGSLWSRAGTLSKGTYLKRTYLKRRRGRNIFVIDLKKALGSSGAAAFVKKSKDARMSGVWIRDDAGFSACRFAT
jgi:hypothetical protein